SDGPKIGLGKPPAERREIAGDDVIVESRLVQRKAGVAEIVPGLNCDAPGLSEPLRIVVGLAQIGGEGGMRRALPPGRERAERQGVVLLRVGSRRSSPG